MFDRQATRLRVLSIAHTAVSRDVGRRRYHPLGAERDLDIHLLHPTRWYEFGRWRDADPPEDAGITLHALPIRAHRGGPAKWYLHWYPGLARLGRRLDPQVVHLWEEPWSVVAWQALRMKRRKPGIALVLEVDQNILKRLPFPFQSIRRQVLRETSLVLSRSDEATRVVRACGYSGPVHAVTYGVDPAAFHPPAAKPPRPACTALRIGYVGRLVEEKGLDDALDGMARASATVTLAIMGEGPHRAALQARIAALGLQDRVTLRGWGAPADVCAFIGGLDALILLTRTTPMLREQFGRVIIEAQSCGVPVIGSECGAIPNVIGAGGWIVPERNPEAVARLLDHLAAAPERLAACGHAGRDNVATRFTYGQVAQALATAWRAAAACSNAPSGAPMPLQIP